MTSQKNAAKMTCWYLNAWLLQTFENTKKTYNLSTLLQHFPK